jgi:hypothetical protein
VRSRSKLEGCAWQGSSGAQVACRWSSAAAAKNREAGHGHSDGASTSIKHCVSETPVGGDVT